MLVLTIVEEALWPFMFADTFVGCSAYSITYIESNPLKVSNCQLLLGLLVKDELLLLGHEGMKNLLLLINELFIILAYKQDSLLCYLHVFQASSNV